MFLRSKALGNRAGVKRATVLIVVMWLTFALVSVAVYFGQTITLEYRAADNSMAGIQAEEAIDGAISYLKFCLYTYELNGGESTISTDASTLNLSSSLSSSSDSSTSSNEAVVATGIMPSAANGQIGAEKVSIGDDGYFWIVGRDAQGGSATTTTSKKKNSSSAAPTYGLVDEASKLNVNTATLTELEDLPNMTEALASAIVDWRDANDTVTGDVGAESSTYEEHSPSYEAKNANFESIDELLLVHGMTPELLYGEDVNRNGILDPNENDGDKSWPSDNSDGTLDVGFSEYLTAWSREPNAAPDGTKKIDVANVSSTTVQTKLTTLITNKISSSKATSVISAVSSKTITSNLQFYLDCGLNQTEFALIEPYLTVTSGAYRTGLVNAGTASATVLACLPGMTSGLAEQLVSARKGLSQESLASIAWVGSVLDSSVCEEVGPYLTPRSYQYSADIVGTGHDGRGMRRRWVVFTAEKVISVIYERDYTAYGWPLGEGAREAFISSTK
jgi:type II secretory pathway component PulK